ncbi:MAG: DNA polymerase III subunit alpha, partial [Bacteroidales bacterium]|nr:DNA polymerase III subunit alpha [Bacteroidales bacterium]
IFKDDFYLELQNHGLDDQLEVNKTILKLAKEHNVKVVATNDVHYVRKENSDAHDLLICLNTGKDLDDKDRMRYSGEEYLKTPEEMAALFPDVPEAISNTREIVDKIEDYDLRREIILPVFPLPESFEKEDDYLRHLTYEGAKNRYNNISDDIKQRLDYELSVIKDMGFPGYFLIVQDLINEARKMDVMVGPGRGSAAGSAVAYCIGITDIDPIEYNLLFERFLNPERISMPDIDIDFDDEGRDKVLDYVEKKYGSNRVAQIVTFGTMAARMAIRDVARVLKLPLPEADRLAKLVPEDGKISLTKAYKEVEGLRDIVKGKESLAKKTLDFAEMLEGSARHTGTHACGVIIGPDDLIKHIPLSTAKDSKLMVTQYEGKLVESVGLLKMDFLGLKTLSIIKDAIDNIYKSHHVKIDIKNIAIDDEKTFKLYQKGDTIGTFQFESEGMRLHLKDLKPTHFEDLIAMNALYRPGPMGYIPLYINRKHGRDKVEYSHPLIEDILKPTYGIMVYQEQIMKVAQIMGSFTLGKADLLRRAMGKKNKEIMEEQKLVFLEGAKEKNIDHTTAEKVYVDMERFAEYGFNRSHSAAYSLIAYQTAYLKAHYPAEYLAAVLTHNLNDIKKINFFIEEAKRQNISVLGPEVNESDLKFVVNKNGEIRFGLAAIKGLGELAAISIVEERKNAPYKSIFDFAQRVNSRTVNKRCFEALVKAGAFDSFKTTHRAQYFYSERDDQVTFIEKIIKHAGILQNEKNVGPTLFEDEIEIVEPKIPECEPWNKLEQLVYEKEVTGIYLSGHPLEDYKIEIDNFCNIEISTLKENLPALKNKDVAFAGIIASSSHKVLKNGNQYATFMLEDYSDSIQLPLFSEDYLRWKHLLEAGAFVMIKARVQQRYNMANQLEIKI